MRNFVDFVYFSPHSESQKVSQTTQSIFVVRRSKISLTITTFVAIGILAITSSVESSFEFARELTSLTVIPERVESNGWRNSGASLMQDVGENGVLQNFSKSNSAYLGVITSESSESSGSNANGTSPDPVSPSDSFTDGENTQETLPDPATATPEAESDSDAVGADANTPEETVPAEEPPAPAPESEPSAPVSLEDLSRGFLTFTTLSTAVLPLANETLTTPLVADTVTVADVLPESNSVSEDVPAEMSESAGVLDANEEVVQSVTSPTPDSQEVVVDASTDSENDGDSMEFTNFTLPQLESGQFITNAQLRVSLAGFADVPADALRPYVSVSYSFGDEWVEAGSVILESEVSNALNGGYFLFALPPVQHVDELADFTVRVSYEGDSNVKHEVYLDSLWLQLDTETFDKESFKERVSPEALAYLERPTISTLLSSEIDFALTETPQFSLRYESQRNIAVRFLRSLFGRTLAEVTKVEFIHNDLGLMDVDPIIDVTEDGLITVRVRDEDKELLQPGTYTIELTVDEGGKIFTDGFEFQWGLLALNPNKTEYALSESASIALGALSPSGNTLCDATLALYIVDPEQYISQVPVTPSGVCNGNNVVDVPDYTASFVPTKVGTYEMYIERLGVDGGVLAHTHDTFKVVDNHAISIERVGPTRIYPPAQYPMQITVTSGGELTGVLTERVPADFTVYDTDARIEERNGEKVLTWDLNLSAGESRTVSYSFDAPDISPFLYTVGPASISDGAQPVAVSEIYREPSAELLVQASTETDFVTGDTSTPISDVVPVAIDEVVVTPDSAPPDASPEVGVPPETVTSTDTSGEPIAPTAPSESLPAEVSEILTGETGTTTVPESVPVIENTSPVTTPGALFEEHRRWQIASDATGSMIAFWTSSSTIPSGWTCISCTATSTFYNRFPLGGATYGTTGGFATTTHSASGTVNLGTGVNTENNGGNTVSVEGHTHTITPVVASTTTLPAYRALRVIQNNSAGTPATIPAGVVFIFDGTLPSGWACISCTATGTLYDRYPMGQNSIVSSSSNTHRHGITGTTSSAGGSTVTARGNGTQVTASPPAHTHTLSASTTLTNHEPPYLEVLFATSSVSTGTPLNAITMWSDTPPAGWLDRSSNDTKPFYNRYIKGAATYGTTGGAETHTHTDVSASSSQPLGTASRRTGAVGSKGTHTHRVDVTNFTTASNTPPYVTVMFAKYYGLIPIYDQVGFRWFTNVATSTTPTDPWPVGEDGVEENEAISSALTPVKNGDVIRLRMQLNVSNSTTTGESFKLQFGTTTDVCTAVSLWSDVGGIASTTAWIGYNNGSLSDGATLSSSTLTGTDVFESYEEENPTVVLPNEIGIGRDGEWDYVLKQNSAEAGTNYCFRMVESDGTELFSYTQYPMLVTNEQPSVPALTKLFDNEKVASTTPWFEFSATDPESNDLTYQIQIDNDYAFTSTVIDNDTANNGDRFENIVTPSDKDPYTNGETLRFTPGTAFTNGITYYWRVRAQDPTGANAWSGWSQIYSFTIDTSVTVSTWHQTMEEQFDSNTLVGTDALVTDVVQLASGSTTGTTTSSAINFTDGSIGNAWGSLSWTDTETTSDLKYRLQYYSDSSGDWAFIPDADLSGNSTGFDTSPQSLLTLDVETYATIRLVGVFTNAGASPVLSDWTLAWGYRIDTPTNSMPFPNEKVGTTTPTFAFTTTDPQSDDLVYEIQWSTTSAFTASTTRVSSTSAGFINATNGGDTSPFTSGNLIQFTIQSADALVNGRTYWWRTRAIDPNGSNQYSFYTDPQSFTVDNTVTVSTWFQTTAEQFNTDNLSGAITQSTTSVTIATTSTESLTAYAEGSQTSPRYRIWNGTTWSAESNALDVGAAQTWVVTRAAPAENEYILATEGTDSDVNVQVYQNGAWDHLQEITGSVANTAMRAFDVAYEQVSGDALVVSCDGNADPTYYIWDGSTWTNGGAGIGLTGGNTCGWVKLIADPVSDEIIAITRDTGGITYEARVWSGSAWGNSTTWGSMQSTQTNHEGIAAAYEDSGNQAVVAVSNGAGSSFTWRSWNGTTWSTPAVTVALGDDFESGTIVADDGTDNMALCYVDQDRDIGVVRWTGAAPWTGQIEHYATWGATGVIYDDRPVDCIYEVGGARDGYLTVVYATTTGVAYQSWNGAAWSTAARVSTLGPAPRIQVRRTGDNLIQVMSYASTTDRYDYTYWNGSTWSALQTLETDGASGATPYKEPLMIAPKNPVTVGTVVGDPAISFYDGSGPYWQQMSWTDTESGGSSILYQVEYYDGNSWELVPDSLIPGNSTGTSVSPINLSSVLPVSTYSQLRPVANMTCNAGTCPVLSDWTITWSAGITVSGTAQQFDQSTNVTAGTVAVAVNGALQTGKTGTISGGSWSIANVNAAPGDVVTVFVSGANDTNEAVAVARYDGVGNMSGLRLYEQHVALGSDDATTTPFTNASIGLYDYTQDEDLFYDVSGNVLNMCTDVGCGNSELYIMASSTYAPGGDALLNNIENNGTFTMGGHTFMVARSWDNNATTSSATSTVVFVATSTTETIDETGAHSPSFYNLTFGTTTGTATWNLSTALDINNGLTVTRGTLARGAQALTIGGSLTNAANGFWTGVGTTTFDGSGTDTWTDSNAVLQNVGRVVVDGTSKTIQLGTNVKGQSIYIGTDDIFDASTLSHDVTILGDWINNNTFVARSGEVIMAATTTNRTITAGGDAFFDLTFSGAGGSWSFSEAALSVNNDFRVSTGTVTMPTGTTTLAGSFNSVGGIFAHNNATLYMTASGAETIAASGTPFTNNFYNLTFGGSGSWSFLDTSATTTNDFRIQQGVVTLPSAYLSVGGSFANTAGTFVHNSGTVRFTSSGARSIDTNASFNSLDFVGSGSWSFVDASVTALGSLWATGGTVTLPSNTLTLGGSLYNTATLAHNSGTVLFNSTDIGETIDLGTSALYNATFNSLAGGWTITTSATTTNNFTLATTSTFTLASGRTLAVGGTFTNATRNASTTWTGSILSLEAGSYSINTKTANGDTYDTLRVKANTDIQMWNSSAATHVVDASGSLYSQDHAAIDGDLYIFGAYERTSGNEYWSYATDFDGTTLTASTSRQVDVRFASGASASFTNSTLSAVGITTASTSVANQGSGTYTINMSGGTTTALYYNFTNLGATGISLLASNKVTSLANGEIAPGIPGGTGFTISSTTIDRNPQLQIYNVNFSTSTTAVANNVKQIDGTPASYWWFRESSGGLDGESNDLDTGDPGSIRWDDSSLTITISGIVYSDDGVTPMGTGTCDGSTANVRVVVRGGTSYTGSCAVGTGAYSIGGVVITGDPVLSIYLDTNGGAQGAVVTRTPTADISDLDIYQNRVITRHEDAAPLTIANMAVYDGADDADIRYLAATGTIDTLTVLANTELHIASSTTFVPGGNITIHGNGSSTAFDGSLHIDNNATFTGSGTSTYSIAGSFTMDEGATFTSASTSVLMNASTTGKTITTPSTQEITFYNLEFNGAGGGWNINGDVRALQDIDVTTGTVSGTADITVVNGSLSGNGTLAMGMGTTTLENTNTLGGTTAWTFANLVLGSGLTTGTTTPAGVATTTILGKLTINTGHYLDAGSSLWNLAGMGTVFVELGTFLEDTSTVRYSGAGPTTVISTNYYNLDLKAQGASPTYTATGLGILVLGDLTVGGATTTTVTFDASDPALDVNGNVSIESTGTLVGSASAQFTVGGSWDNNGVFTGSGGAVTFDGSGAPTIAAGTSWFSSVLINGSGAFTISEHATATTAFTLTSAGSFTLANGQALAVGGTFTSGVSGALTTWTGSILSLYGGGNYTLNTSALSDTYETLRIANGTQIRMWNSSASSYDVSSTGSLYSQDHAGVNGDLYIYGAYTKTTGTDFWNHATDFDGTDISGSPRNVDVYIASGGSVLYTGGGLSVIGSAAASTTIQNQGSGTYGFRIGGSASTTWSYYQVRNTDSAGLTFSGTPNVVTLSYGNFEVGQNSGTAITVGGTVITQNQAKTFTNNYFGAAGGVSPAYNVTATGTTISSWRFTNHTGAFDGEGNDVDPDGDPGYIVWDDSAALVTVSGTVYSDEGTTASGVCDGSTQNVHLRVAGLTSYTTSCDGAGDYSIVGVAYSPTDSLVVYIDGETEKAATVTEDPISSINNLDLYENRVIVRHEGTDPLSIADMAVWDSSDDADIPFTAIDASPDTLTLPANRKLIVWDTKEFEPNGNVTISGGGGGAAYDGTLELYANATFDATGSEAHSIGGSLLMGSGAIFDDENSTVTFTTSGASRTIDTNEYSFYNLTFNGSGSWNITNTALQVGNDLTITQGVVTLPSGTTTITGSLGVTGGSFIASGGTMVFNSAAAETVAANGSNFGALVIAGAGSFVMSDVHATATRSVRVQAGTLTSASGIFTIGGDFNNSATFTHNSGTLRFISTTTALVVAGGSDLASTTFAGNGAFAFTDTNVALQGSLRIQNGSVALASGTMSIAGSFLNTGGSFTHSTGTILFNSSDTGESINPGSSPFATVAFASAGGGWTITGNATTTGNLSLTSATNFTVSSSTRLAVGGVFTNLVGGGATTWTGSTLVINTGSAYTINTKVAGGDTYNVVLVGSSTALRAWDSAGTIAMTDGVSSFYSQDNGGVSGALYLYGNYVRTTGTDYWSYATDFDGTVLTGVERQVYVYMASGATTTFTGGTLNIVGANGFDTTISNQGSGTYAMSILDGTLNAQYYNFANMDADGLVLSGTPTISSLTEGNFTLAVNGGSLITLSSTTLNYNAGLVISNTSFATTSAITGYNVTLVGTTPSAWTFTNHSGNLDGESFDSDGGDACGSLRWDDSACLLTQQSAYRFRNDDGGEGVPNSEWYDQNWTKRKRVTVTNADPTTYTNAAIKLTVTHDGDMQTDFDDLRFTSTDGTTLVNHFIESYTASTEAVVWVEIPSFAASANTEVYMYYGNGAVSDASATGTFNFIDTFEDGNISEYSGDTSLFTVDGTFSYERDYGLDATGNESAKATDGIYRTGVTVSQGETLRYLQYINTGAGAGDETCTLFGVQNPGSNNQNYAVCLELYGTDRVSISRDVDYNDTSGTVLASTTITYSTGWYEIEIDWDTDDTIDVTVLQNGSVVATTSATDGTYTSGGVGFTFWFQNGGWDIYSSRPLLATEPTTSFGFEQVSGGASWLAARNTVAAGVEAGDTVRVRFLIENTGLTVTDQNYEIEYAAKGNAPSCESVDYNDYVEVPDAGICGSSELCMVGSSNVTNLASTTDLLGGEGTFTYGQIVEDPSNNTGNISVLSNQFTELEYVITPTINVTDSNYCLRVTNEGAELDSYTRIAELGLLFAPNVTALSLNGGNDIILTGGATTTVYATGTVTDFNGWIDIAGATTTVYRNGPTGVGESCTPDNNNCYRASAPACSLINCAGDSCEVMCSFDIYYHADPTDTGSFFDADAWTALLEVSDYSNSAASGTSPSVDLLTLRAISVDSSINYGTLEVNADTGAYNATTTVANIGNDSLDVLIEGTDLTDGGSSIIPVNEQKFATSTFTYTACTFCSLLSTTPASYELNLSKPSSVTPVVDEVFWGIAVPFGVAGTAHQGVNVFYATGD